MIYETSNVNCCIERLYGTGLLTRNHDNGSNYMSMQLTPNFTLEQLPKVDVLVIPGGGPAESNQDETIVRWIKKQYEQTETLFSVCSGAFVYGKKGNEAFEEVARIDAGGQRLNFCEPAILTDGAVLVPASHYLRKVWVQRFDPDHQHYRSSGEKCFLSGARWGIGRTDGDCIW